MNASSDIGIGIPPSSGGYTVAVRVFGAIFLATTAWLVATLATDPAAVPWDFLVVNYIYLLGLTQFGVCFVAIMRLSGARWSRPYHRLGELMTMAYGPFAIIGFLVIFYFGRHELYYWIGDAGDVHLSPFQNEIIPVVAECHCATRVLQPGQIPLPAGDDSRYPDRRLGQRICTTANDLSTAGVAQ